MWVLEERGKKDESHCGVSVAEFFSLRDYRSVRVPGAGSVCDGCGGVRVAGVHHCARRVPLAGAWSHSADGNHGGPRLLRLGLPHGLVARHSHLRAGEEGRQLGECLACFASTLLTVVLQYGVVAWVKDFKWGIVAFSIIMSVLVGWRRGVEGDAPLGFFSDAPFQVLSPAGTLFAYLPWMVLWKSNVLLSAGIWGWAKLVLLIAVLVPSVYIPRFFCRHICPMGAVLQPLAPFKFLRIRRQAGTSKEDCNRILDEVCPMGVKVADSDAFVSDSNCIHCGNCPTAAPDVFSQTVA